MTTPIALHRCRCNSGKLYSECCEVIINDFSKAETAEQLMRSRYTAYTQGNLAYIKKTMAGNALKEFERNKKEGVSEPTQWLGLVIHSSKSLEKRGFVEFTVTYLRDGKKLNMREHSLFKKIAGCWLYIGRQ